MTSVIYGLSYDLQEKKEFRYIIPAISGLNVRTGVICQSAIISWRRLDRRLFKHAIRCRNAFVGFVERLMKDRMCAKSIEGDAFSLLLRAKDPHTQQAMTIQQLGSESINLIVAGESLLRQPLCRAVVIMVLHNGQMLTTSSIGKAPTQPQHPFPP